MSASVRSTHRPAVPCRDSRSCERQACLPRAPRAREREQTDIAGLQPAEDVGDLALPTDERRCWLRQVRGSLEAAERREVSGRSAVTT